MARFLLHRLAVAVPVMFVVATLTFFLVQLVPGDPASFILGGSASAEQIQQLHEKLGLNQSVPAQYVTWLTDAVRGDFGDSFVSGTSARLSVLQALPVTVSVAVMTTLITLVVGIFLGVLAAARGGTADRVIQGACSLGMAIPNFWLAVLLIWALAVKAKLFPATDYVPLTQSPGQWLLHVLLPALSISVGTLGQVVFQTRAAAKEVLAREYIRTLRAAGIPQRRILFKHVLRNAAIPVTTVLGITFIFTLGGVVVIEAIFNLPGLGYLMLQSVSTHDLSVVQAGVIFFSLVVVLANLVTDTITTWLDPRVRVA